MALLQHTLLSFLWQWWCVSVRQIKTETEGEGNGEMMNKTQRAKGHVNLEWGGSRGGGGGGVGGGRKGKLLKVSYDCVVYSCSPLLPPTALLWEPPLSAREPEMKIFVCISLFSIYLWVDLRVCVYVCVCVCGLLFLHVFCSLNMFHCFCYI